MILYSTNPATTIAQYHQRVSANCFQFQVPKSKFNPFDTMRFQYFALISTGMRGTHVHLPIMTLIYGLKLNNRHGLIALWCESTANYLDPIYNFLPLFHMT